MEVRAISLKEVTLEYEEFSFYIDNVTKHDFNSCSIKIDNSIIERDEKYTIFKSDHLEFKIKNKHCENAFDLIKVLSKGYINQPIRCLVMGNQNLQDRFLKDLKCDYNESYKEHILPIKYKNINFYFWNKIKDNKEIYEPYDKVIIFVDEREDPAFWKSRTSCLNLKIIRGGGNKLMERNISKKERYNLDPSDESEYESGYESEYELECNYSFKDIIDFLN